MKRTHKMKTKTEMKIILGILAVLVALPLVAADSHQLWCLYDGESVNFGQLCAPGRPTVTAPNHGSTSICVHLLDNGKICHASLSKCYGLGLSCSNSTTGGNTTIDITPPTLEISSPLNGSTFTSRNVLLEMLSDETVALSYQKDSNPGKWNTLCSNCGSYSKERSFDEGLNEITIRAVDKANNEALYARLFYVDSKKPKINSLEPSEGFASGTFRVTFTEDNPKELVLHYGNSETGFRNKSFGLSTDCIQLDGEAECATTVNLADYEGEQIEVYATLLDAAGNLDETSHAQLAIDNTAPIISNFSYLVQGKKVTFTLEINEPYLSEVTYIDNSENNPKEKSLCSKLVNNVCEKQVNLKSEGSHNVQVIVRDLAGNEAAQNFTLFADSKKPKIKDVLPSDGFTSGLFEVTFEEQNPMSVVLEYGNVQTGFRTQNVQLSGCSKDGDEYYCSTSVALGDFDGQEIEYKFTVTDLAGQTDEKQQKGLAVDISFPVIKSLNYTVNGKDVFFSINVDEPYLKEISYIDNSDPKLQVKKLCSKLTNEFCEKKVSFRNDGLHEVTLEVTDLAGHAVSQNIEFFTDSKKPKIKSIFPEKDSTFGLFDISFEEQNPTSLILEYGNNALGFRTAALSLANDCTSDNGKYSCSINVDLSDYDGYEIMYDFTLTDRVGQTASDGAAELLVDITFPEFDSLTYNLTSSTKAKVILQATEPNVEVVTYINLDDSKPRQQTFCSRLSAEGICEKKLSINPGTNRIDFVIIDKAGNSAVQQLVIAN